MTRFFLWIVVIIKDVQVSCQVLLFYKKPLFFRCWTLTLGHRGRCVPAPIRESIRSYSTDVEKISGVNEK